MTMLQIYSTFLPSDRSVGLSVPESNEQGPHEIRIGIKTNNIRFATAPFIIIILIIVTFIHLIIGVVTSSSH